MMPDSLNFAWCRIQWILHNSEFHEVCTFQIHWNLNDDGFFESCIMNDSFNFSASCRIHLIFHNAGSNEFCIMQDSFNFALNGITKTQFLMIKNCSSSIAWRTNSLRCNWPFVSSMITIRHQMHHRSSQDSPL